MKYDIRFARKDGKIHCSNCDKLLGWYGDNEVTNMDFCPYFGYMFERDYIQYLRDEIELA